MYIPFKVNFIFVTLTLDIFIMLFDYIIISNDWNYSEIWLLRSYEVSLKIKYIFDSRFFFSSIFYVSYNFKVF